ncbi:unnamed protein product, partial [Rhizoctonia solani]
MRFSLALFVLPVALVAAAPAGKRCTGTISSLNDVAAAQKSTSTHLPSPPARPLPSLASPALPSIYSEMSSSESPTGPDRSSLSVAPMSNVSYASDSAHICLPTHIVNGNGHTFDGQGPSYWDGQGGNGGVTKPHPMMKIKISGTYSNVKVLNSPAHVYSISN